MLQKFKLLKRKGKAKKYLLMAILQEHMRRFSWNDDGKKEIWEALRTSSEGLDKDMTDSNNYFSLDVMLFISLFAKQSEDWDLLHEDLEQIDELDIEEMDINWQIAMIAIRMKKFYKKQEGEFMLMEKRQLALTKEL
ncbi:hypothetical protein Tco_0312501 [Tanacetum coccineum]